MHYVSGHEVAAQIRDEVVRLAHSPTIAWVRCNAERKERESYYCRVGDIIATKIVEPFDCSPQLFLDTLSNIKQMSYGSTDISMLEEYDSCNQIILIEAHGLLPSKMVRSCIYRNIHSDPITGNHHIIFQSIDHDMVQEDDDTVIFTYAPSGYLISPHPDPNKCILTFVVQIMDMGDVSNDFVDGFCQSAGISGLMLDEFKAQITKYKSMKPSAASYWKKEIDANRKEMYNMIFELTSSNEDWKFSHHRGIDIYTQRSEAGFHAALRSSFFSSEPCKLVACRLYNALLHTDRFNKMTYNSVIKEVISDGASILLNDTGSYEKGLVTDTLLLVTCNFNNDGTCDLSFKSIVDDRFPAIPGRPRIDFPLCGFIVSPNTHGSTIQYMMQSPPSRDEDHLKIACARLINYLYGLRGYLTRQPTSVHPVAAPPNNSEEYEKVFKAFAKLVLDDKLPTDDKEVSSPPFTPPQNLFSSPPITPPQNQFDSPPITPPQYPYPPDSPTHSQGSDSSRSSTPPLSNVSSPSSMMSPPQPSVTQMYKRKRKYSASLVSVEELVRKIVPGESPARPFLFLVPNSQDGQRHRFIRRRWGTSLSNSVFDLLPEEVFEAIMALLDPPALFKMALVCVRFKDLLSNNRLWRNQYITRWGHVTGRLARRYCGDDAPSSFFTPSFSHWHDIFLEKQLIEAAWEAPAHHAHRFRVDHAHTRAVRALALLPQCRRLVTGSLDKIVRVWDAVQGGCLATLQGVSGVVSLGGAGDTVVKAGYKSGAVRRIDVVKGEVLGEIRLGEAMRGCTFLPGRIVTWDETDVEFWDEEAQQRLHTFNGHARHISDCVFSEKNSILYSASRDKTVKLWDLNTGTRVATISGHTRGVNGIVLLGHNQCVTVSTDASMRVWDTRNLAQPFKILTEHTGKIRCIQYTEIGKKICTGGADGVRIWQSDTFEHLRHDPVENTSSLAMDEESVAYGAVSGVLQFYDFVPHAC